MGIVIAFWRKIFLWTNCFLYTFLWISAVIDRHNACLNVYRLPLLLTKIRCRYALLSYRLQHYLITFTPGIIPGKNARAPRQKINEVITTGSRAQ